MAGLFMVLKLKSFEIALKKGEIGEAIIRRELEKKGWIVYLPFTKNKPHYFDMLATLNKEKVIAIDVKTKARLNKWAAQGLNKTHYLQYEKFTKSNNVPFWIIWVDDKSGEIHGGEIRTLPLTEWFEVNDKIIACPLSKLKFIGRISQEEIDALSELDQRNYDYNPVD